jgi:hypothetical protein
LTLEIFWDVRGVEWWLFTGVSEQRIGSTFKPQEFQAD